MFPDLGLEKTPQEFIERMVAIFAEVYRVLRDDGCVWLNMGDSFAGSGGMGGGGPGDLQQSNVGSRMKRPPIKMPQGNLLMMPHRIAIALQDWGWVVRNDVVWFKRNPMPESQAGWRFERERKKSKDGNTTIGKLDREEGKASWTVFSGQGTRRENLDNPEYEYGEDYQLRKGSWRHTRAHEYVFMLTKKMQYWSNQEAVREATGDNTHSRGIKRDPPIDHAGQGHKDWVSYMDRDDEIARSGRNPRSVMDVPTAPYSGAHYATFPPNLIAPLIRATCPRWACPVCGQGWSPVVEKTAELEAHRKVLGLGPKTVRGGDEGTTLHHDISVNVKEYRPTCDCEALHISEDDKDYCVRCKSTIQDMVNLPACFVPGIVLDPFVGSGTTVMVAQRLLRRGVGLDISMEYLDEQAKIRTGEGSPSGVLDDLPLFALTDNEA